jgi:hypothetical protein
VPTDVEARLAAVQTCSRRRRRPGVGTSRPQTAPAPARRLILRPSAARPPDWPDPDQQRRSGRSTLAPLPARSRARHVAPTSNGFLAPEAPAAGHTEPTPRDPQHRANAAGVRRQTRSRRRESPVVRDPTKRNCECRARLSAAQPALRSIPSPPRLYRLGRAERVLGGGDAANRITPATVACVVSAAIDSRAFDRAAPSPNWRRNRVSDYQERLGD